MLGNGLMLQLCHWGTQTPRAGGMSSFVLLMIVCLDFCLYVTANSHDCVCTSEVQAGLRWQKEVALKHVWMSCWSAHLSELLSEMVLLCKSSNSLIFLIFLFRFFSLWCWTQAEWSLSAPIWATAPVNPAHPSPWHTGHVLLCPRPYMDTSEEIVCVPKMLQSQSLKAKTCLARGEEECVQLFLLQATGTGSVLS